MGIFLQTWLVSEDIWKSVSISLYCFNGKVGRGKWRATGKRPTVNSGISLLWTIYSYFQINFRKPFKSAEVKATLLTIDQATKIFKQISEMQLFQTPGKKEVRKRQEKWSPPGAAPYTIYVLK